MDSLKHASRHEIGILWYNEGMNTLQSEQTSKLSEIHPSKEPYRGMPKSSYYDFLKSLSDTDRELEEANPGFYLFSAKVSERKCLTCEKPFKTRLSLAKFCSRACRPGSPESYERIST
jgi:hypothetical protein